MTVVTFVTQYALAEHIIDHLKLKFVAEKSLPFHHGLGGKFNAGRENSAPRAEIQHAAELGNAYPSL